MKFGWRYFLRRILVATLLIWLLSVLTFGLYFAIPDEPANFLIDVQHAKPAQIAKARHKLGVDRPWYIQYEKYMGRLVHGDFGLEWSGIQFDPITGRALGAPVAPVVTQAAEVSGLLALGGVVMLLVLAIPMAMLAAARVGTWVDKSLMTVSLVGISVHPIIIGMLLQTYVAIKWHLIPGGGYCPLHKPHPVVVPGRPAFPVCGGFVDWSTHMILPWITFALFFVALYMRIIRVRLLDVLDTDFVRAARARGASEYRVLRRHALPNAYLPIITMIGMDAGAAVGLAVYVEIVYGLPGLGALTVRTLGGDQTIDLPMIIGIVLVVGTAIIVLNLLVDFVYAFVDPNLRTRGDRAAVSRAPVGGAI